MLNSVNEKIKNHIVNEVDMLIKINDNKIILLSRPEKIQHASSDMMQTVEQGAEASELSKQEPPNEKNHSITQSGGMHADSVFFVKVPDYFYYVKILSGLFIITSLINLMINIIMIIPCVGDESSYEYKRCVTENFHITLYNKNAKEKMLEKKEQLLDKYIYGGGNIFQ